MAVRNILIVEDQRLARMYLSSCVEKCADCAVAGTLSRADAALSRCDEGRIDLILMDICTENDSDGLTAAAALALGIGIQNFPEGAAVALPLHQEGLSRMKSFVYGALSGIVEPLFGVAVVLVSAQLTPFMPWLLSAAAGAMLYVVVEELIPEAHLGEHSHSGTLGVMAGFLVMMILDVALG